MIEFDENQILFLILVFLRNSALIFALPLFGDSPIPVRARVLLGVATTMGIMPVFSEISSAVVINGVTDFFIVGIKEIFIGLILGFTAQLAFTGLIMAASLSGFQMGFGTADLLIPDSNMQLSGFTAFHRVIVMSIFLLFDFHHLYFSAIAKSYEVVGPGTVIFSTDYATFFKNLSAMVFETSLQLAAPILVALMFTMAALGLIARTVPQINIFTLSFPASFFIGLAVYLLTLPLMPGWYESYFSIQSENLYIALRGMVR